MCTRFAVPEMIAAGGGVDRQHLVHRGPARAPVPHRLLLGQGRAGRHDLRPGARARPRTTSRVNAIAPGAVEGDRIDRVIAGQAEVRGVAVEDMRQSFVERSPLKRMATADDIAALAVFLCSDTAREHLRPVHRRSPRASPRSERAPRHGDYPREVAGGRLRRDEAPSHARLLGGGAGHGPGRPAPARRPRVPGRSVLDLRSLRRRRSRRRDPPRPHRHRRRPRGAEDQDASAALPAPHRRGHRRRSRRGGPLRSPRLALLRSGSLPPSDRVDRTGSQARRRAVARVDRRRLP